MNGKGGVMEISFGVMKKGEPIAMAKYIKRYVAKASRQNRNSNMWATKVLKENDNSVKEKRIVDGKKSHGHKG
eukprot:3854065-Ditylum_brightwellii.AAC.2